MNIDQILNEWDTDATIDDTHLDHASIDTAKLHSKYLSILIKNKLKTAKYETDYNILRHKKSRYYRGEMDRDELAEMGWTQYQGIRPTNSALEEILLGDKDINDMNLKLQYLKTSTDLLESIMSQLKSRDFQISNAIKWKTFINGS